MVFEIFLFFAEIFFITKCAKRICYRHFAVKLRSNFQAWKNFRFFWLIPRKFLWFIAFIMCHWMLVCNGDFFKRHDKRMKVKTLRLRLKLRKLLKKFDQNFNIKSHVRAIWGLNFVWRSQKIKVLMKLFQKFLGCGVKPHGFVFSCVCRASSGLHPFKKSKGLKNSKINIKHALHFCFHSIIHNQAGWGVVFYILLADFC